MPPNLFRAEDALIRLQPMPEVESQFPVKPFSTGLATKPQSVQKYLRRKMVVIEWIT
jgi:hypothetical protein